LQKNLLDKKSTGRSKRTHKKNLGTRNIPTEINDTRVKPQNRDLERMGTVYRNYPVAFDEVGFQRISTTRRGQEKKASSGSLERCSFPTRVCINSPRKTLQGLHALRLRDLFFLFVPGEKGSRNKIHRGCLWEDLARAGGLGGGGGGGGGRRGAGGKKRILGGKDVWCLRSQKRWIKRGHRNGGKAYGNNESEGEGKPKVKASGNIWQGERRKRSQKYGGGACVYNTNAEF